eukprot:TRINITY_DN10161_c0_g1_i1.p1 TRINITY_DN10161_c0_g1~~TRINITY_DN10161_c0_g1_i1.p1  ORF type:complete len:115 (-),score=57.94 TRINITY_DN10161_c0_g1_i1:37-381(-)
MSDDHDEVEREEEEAVKTRDQREQQAALSSLSGGSQEEKELDSTKALEKTKELFSKQATAKSQREKELALVTVKKEDIEFLKNEMELSQSEAENGLRENNGDLKEYLRKLVLNN